MTGDRQRFKSSPISGLLVAALEQMRNLCARASSGELANAAQVMEQERAIVAHAEVLHLERADAVFGTERARDLFHRELVRVVRHVLRARLEDRVVVATAKLERDAAGDRRR